MPTPNRTKLVENAVTLLKSPSLWGKFVGVLMTLLLLFQAYYDIRSDIRKAEKEASEAQAEVDEAQEKILNKGKLSELNTGEAIRELQDTMQFLYEEVVLLQDHATDLALENKRLKARLDRYRDLSGIPPEEMDESDLRSLAHLLLPFMVSEPEYEAVDTGEPAMVVMSEGPDPEEDDPPVAKSKRGKRVGEDGKLKFEKEPAKAF
jgi:hypothetical protein